MLTFLLLLGFQLEPGMKAAVVESFRRLNRFEVHFKQEIYSDFFEESVVEGYLLVSRPGNMRMEYLKGDRKTFIWDGETCYEHDLLADTRSRTPQREVRDEPLVQLLLYGSDLDTFFIIDRYKDEMGEIYRLRPRDGDPYQIEIMFDERWLPKYLEVEDEEGEGSRFFFKDYVLDPQIALDAFSIPPEKVENDP